MLQAQTKCVFGLTIDRDNNYFAGYSEDPVGVVSVWDRRGGVGRGAQGWAEPSLVFQKATVDESGQSGRVCGLRYSGMKNGVLGVLNTSGGLRVYEMAKLPELGGDGSARDAAAAVVGSVFGGGGGGDGWKRGAPFMLGRDNASVGSSGASKTGETLCVSKVTDIAEAIRPQGIADRRIGSFDWMNFWGAAGHAGDNGNGIGSGSGSGDIKTICMRNNTELEVISIPGSSCAATISGRNMVVATKGTDLIMLPTKPPGTQQPPTTADNDAKTVVDDARSLFRRRHSDADYAHHANHGSPERNGDGKRPTLGARDRKDSLLGPPEADGYVFPPEEVLTNDICVVMRQRVENGYGMDPEKSLKMVQGQENDALTEMWIWLKDAVGRADAGGMTAHYLDFNYVGVKQILKGDLGMFTTGILLSLSNGWGSYLKFG